MVCTQSFFCVLGLFPQHGFSEVINILWDLGREQSHQLLLCDDSDRVARMGIVSVLRRGFLSRVGFLSPC